MDSSINNNSRADSREQESCTAIDSDSIHLYGQSATEISENDCSKGIIRVQNVPVWSFLLTFFGVHIDRKANTKGTPSLSLLNKVVGKVQMVRLN